MTPRAEGLAPGYGHESHIVKTHYFFKKLLLYLGGWFTQTQKDSFDDVHIDSYSMLKQFILHLSSATVDFYLFYDGALDM